MELAKYYDVSRKTITRMVNKVNKTRDFGLKPRLGPPATVMTESKRRELGEELKKHPKLSINVLAKKTGISYGSAQNYV